MPKAPVDFEHHQPRQIDKKKHHRAGFSEDARENRKTRVSFKNYVRQVREEEIAAEVDEQWIVEFREGGVVWEEVAGPFTNEEDANDMMDELLESAEEDDQYRVTRLDE